MDWALPKEILAIIFSNLSLNDLFIALTINKYWHNMRDCDSVWKDLVFRGAFPHDYQQSDVGINWHHLVRSFVETRKNLRAGRFTMETIAARAPEVNNWKKDIVPACCSVNDKYCLIEWRSIEKHEDTPGYEFCETELWDLETKQKIKSYSEHLTFYGRYVVSSTFEVAPFELNSELQWRQITLPKEKSNMLSMEGNSDVRSPYVIVQSYHWSELRMSFWVLNLADGEQVYADESGDGFKHVDVIRGTKEKTLWRSAITRTIEEIISVDEEYLYRYNIRTKVERRIEIEKRFGMAPEETKQIYLVHGVIALNIDNRLWFIDPEDGSLLKCIGIPSLQSLQLVPRKHSSFKDEDVYRPIEILEISSMGETKILKYQHGSLYKILQPSAYTSLLVHETAYDRYTLVYITKLEGDVKHNPFATKLLQQRQVQTPNHKAITIQRLLGPQSGTFIPYTSLSMDAFGTCFVIYEKMIDGKWCVDSPNTDQWQVIRDKMMSPKTREQCLKIGPK